ncbi:ATP-binding protein [Pandoraea capi]|uniref:sensor histidine kinase n=1 Tax=Pandoraea TaxID=93217 RepID=UPI001F5CB77E|nr:ATP-binding protein [Pandoraea capi]MCI3204287.1 hypothetical protein [Pandoraea sp. LA3]MDN4582313.1 hypothetical protein [Pandoraea capi]
MEALLVLLVIAAQSITILALLKQRRERKLAEHEAATRRADLTRAARIATVGELSASIAHEVGQPLGAILSNVDAAGLLMRDAPDNAHAMREIGEILNDVRRDALRANDVIVRLRALLQKQSITFTPVDFDAVLERAASLVRPEARRRGIVVDVSLDTHGTQVLADQVQLQQVLLNLAINAMDAMENAEHPDRVLSIATKTWEDGVELIVGDNGVGIPDESVEQLFESFYTTKSRGTGLGLSIVRSIVEAHRGTVTARRKAVRGTEFVLWLPLAPTALAGESTRSGDSFEQVTPH